MQMLRPK